MIRVTNKQSNWTFQYAHFLCDCLFPEINLRFYEQDVVIRKRAIEETLGNFSKMYEQVMGVKYMELPEDEFAKFPAPLHVVGRSNKPSIGEFECFREYMFSKFSVRLSSWFAPIVLVQRGENRELVSHPDLKTDKKTGAEVREITEIEVLKSHLEENYSSYHKTVILEDLPLKDQMECFANAKIIIAAHGSALSNMLFCQPNTIVIEVDCGPKWEFFNTISSSLKIKHLLCPNDLEQIKKALDVEFKSQVALW